MANGAFLYLAVWLDLYSRRIIGWQLEDNIKEELFLAAFKKNYQSRSAKPGLLIHSDRGGQGFPEINLWQKSYSKYEPGG